MMNINDFIHYYLKLYSVFYLVNENNVNRIKKYKKEWFHYLKSLVCLSICYFLCEFSSLILFILYTFEHLIKFQIFSCLKSYKSLSNIVKYLKFEKIMYLTLSVIFHDSNFNCVFYFPFPSRLLCSSNPISVQFPS